MSPQMSSQMSSLFPFPFPFPIPFPAERLQIYFGEMDPGLLELRNVIFNKFRMFRPWRTKQQDPLQVLQVHCKYSDRTKDHYRLNTVLRGAGKGKLKNKCTVVPYVTSSEASDKPRLLHRTVRLLADHLEKAGWLAGRASRGATSYLGHFVISPKVTLRNKKYEEVIINVELFFC